MALGPVRVTVAGPISFSAGVSTLASIFPSSYSTPMRVSILLSLLVSRLQMKSTWSSLNASYVSAVYVIVEASLLWMTVFRSRGRLTSSGSVKLAGADCGAMAWVAAVVGGAAVVDAASVTGGALAAWARLPSDFEQPESRTAKMAAAVTARRVPMICAPHISPVCTPSWPEAGAPDASLRTLICKRQLTGAQALTVRLSGK